MAGDYNASAKAIAPESPIVLPPRHKWVITCLDCSAIQMALVPSLLIPFRKRFN